MNKQISVLYVLGGYSNSKALQSVSFYDPESDSWDSVYPEIPFKRTNFGCVSIGKLIFVIGGSNGSRDMETIFKLNIVKGTWSELPPMKYRRQGCGAACSADCKYIYVAGGWDGEQAHSVVEQYSIQDRKWTTVKPMSVARSNVQLVELGGYLYALGGLNDGNDSINECYDPKTDQWSSIAPMNNIDNLFGAAVLDGKIYVLGQRGFEMYSPEEDRWIELRVPEYRSMSKRLVALNGELLAIGGMVIPHKDINKNFLTDMGMPFVGSFDVEKQIWSRKSDMDIGRASPGVAVVNNS